MKAMFVSDGPLAGVRVLDLSTMIAAPLTASLLADWGAYVVKVERPDGGDHVRRFGAQNAGEGLYWKTLSRGKRSVAIDLRLPEGQSLVRRWAASFDVIIENFRPGTLEKWNLAPETLRAEAPRLVILRMTAFGQDGPYRDHPGFGTIAEAMSGLAAVSGFEDRPPLLPPAPLADVMAGYLGAAAISAALVGRDRTGRGDTIDLAIYEAALKLLELQIIEYDRNGTLHKRQGNRLEDAAPRGSYQCRDGKWLALSGSTQEVALRVLRTIGGEAVVNNPRFRTNVERVEHAEELDALIAAWCGEREREVAIETMRRAGCAVGPLENVQTMFENPQVVARESIVRVADARLGAMRMANVFPRFLGTPLLPGEPGPSEVGAHTRELLHAELGLDDAELARLREAGAIAWGARAAARAR